MHPTTLLPRLRIPPVPLPYGGDGVQFRYFEVATLPRLAWCARITRDDDTVAVFHGSRVETRARGFVEGAWSGPFDAFDLAGATVVCGTGAVADADDVRFSTSTDPESLLFGV